VVALVICMTAIMVCRTDDHGSHHETPHTGGLHAVAAEGIDWMWAHRVDDMAHLDLVKLTLRDLQQAAEH